MAWQELVAVLREQVGEGQVTTYGNCSEWANGHRLGGRGIAAGLRRAAREGCSQLTNRVVSSTGKLGAAVEEYGQLSQLQREKVPFRAERRINLALCPPVVLTRAV